MEQKSVMIAESSNGTPTPLDVIASQSKSNDTGTSSQLVGNIAKEEKSKEEVISLRPGSSFFGSSAKKSATTPTPDTSLISTPVATKPATGKVNWKKERDEKEKKRQPT
jgi:hypothetical protein